MSRRPRAQRRVVGGRLGTRGRLVLGISLATAGLLLCTGSAAALPPGPVTAPTIAGTPQVGNSLTYTQGSWSNGPSTITDVWMECPSSGAPCSQIQNTMANQPSYTLVNRDVGSTIEIEETASNNDGASVIKNYSSRTAPVTALPVPTKNSPPTITGVTWTGQVLTEHDGSWSNNPTSLSHLWLRCPGTGACVSTGQSGSAYTLTGADAGSSIEVQETASNAGGPGTPAVSGPTGVVTNPPGATASTTSTDMLASPTAPVTDQTVLLIATVSSGTGQARPSGWLSFESGGAPLAGCAGLPIAPSGQTVTVTCQAAFAAGTVPLHAVFTPQDASSVTGSTSAPLTLVIGRAPSAISVWAPPQLGFGKATYSAVVNPAAAGSGSVAPSGQVEFSDNGKPIGGCLSQSLIRGSATCAVDYTGSGRHLIAAVYRGDANFIGGGSPTQAVTVLPTAPRGFVTSTMTWSFFFTPTYTKVAQLFAQGLAPGSTIALVCHGGGCPFHRLTPSASHLRRCPSKGKRGCTAPGTMNLIALFRGVRLRVGSQLIVEIQHPAWLGKYYRFVIRRGRPRVVTSCLAVGSARPGVGC